MVKRYDPLSGEFAAAMKSQQMFGPPIFTKEFAATRTNDDAIFIFGGRDGWGGMPPILWHGLPEPTGEEVV